MNRKIVRVLGKRGRITIPYEIRVRNKIGYTNKEIIENNMLKQYPDSYYPPSRSARRSASGGQVLSQSNEPLFREPAQSVRTD